MNISTAINIAHILLIGPLFIYIGLMKGAIHEFIYIILASLGFFVIILHSYLGYFKIIKNKSALINLIHIFILAPVMLIVAFYMNSANIFYYRFLLAGGFLTIFYHGFKLTS